MSHPFLAPKPAMPPALRGELSPLLYLVGTLESRLDDDEWRRLKSVLRSCLPPLREYRSGPPGAEVAPFPISPRHPVSIIHIQGEEPFLLYHAAPSPDAPDGVLRLGLARIWAPLLHAQNTFRVLEEHDPIRAAALSLRGLAEIWKALLEIRRFDVLIGEEFLGLYREALLQAQALTVRPLGGAPA